MNSTENSEVEHSNNSIQYQRPKSIKTMKEVMESTSKQQSWLVENLIPSGQLTALVAPSDVGKSIFCRQLSVTSVLNEDSFIGHKLNAEGRQVIYISTEDMDHDWKEKMEKYPLSLEQTALVSDKMLLITNYGGTHGDLYKLIENEIKHNPTALVVFDVFTDIYTSDLNSSVEIRKFLKPYKNLAAIHNTAMLFVHHVSKKGESTGQHGKQNVLGSQAIEASMRSVLELRKDGGNTEERILKITKGNYVSERIKKMNYRFKLNQHLIYEPCAMFDTSIQQVDIVEKVKTYFKNGESSRGISKLLEQENISVGKSKIAEIIKQFKENEDVHKQ